MKHRQYRAQILDGHPIAYTKLLQASQSFERPPIFLKEDSKQITQDPIMSEKVPI
jgi:hypothetical protein